MTPTTQDCLAYGPAVALFVAILKAVPGIGGLVARNPKIMATLISLLGFAGLAHFTGTGAVDWLAVAKCTAIAFSSAVATHEVALAPIGNAIAAAKDVAGSSGASK